MKKFMVMALVVSALNAETTMVKDNATKLIWEDTVHVELTKVTHTQAEKYCSKLELGEMKDWRLPTLNELLSIVDFKKYKPAILKEFTYINKDTLYWTSTPYVRSADEYWGISFKDGATSNASISYDRYVRCVRDVK